MLFRRKHDQPRHDAWQAFAERLELEDASAAAERMRRWLDLDDVTLDPVYALRRDEQPTLYIFEYLRRRSGPAGSVGQRVSNCLLRADAPFAPIALRAHPKRNPVLESLEASRTGSSMIDTPSPCSPSISVFARDPDRAMQVVTVSVCRALSRALEERGADAVIIGERHLLTTVETDEPAAGTVTAEALASRHEKLEALAGDLFALYALLRAQLYA